VKELQAIVRRLTAPDWKERPPLVLATLVTVEGSSYRRAGARRLFGPNGESIGSISGGCLEEDVSAHARAVAATGQPVLATYDTTSENDLIWGTGAGCHGVVRVLLELVRGQPDWAQELARNLAEGRPTELAVVWQTPDGLPSGTTLAANLTPPLAAGASVFHQTVSPAPTLFIFGAGDDASPLVRGAKELGWKVVVADPRPAFAAPARFPEADLLIVGPAEELVSRAAPGAGDCAVVMTHHYIHDTPVLRGLLGLPLAYLGLLGPRPRADRILADLGQAGLVVTPAQRQRLRAPVGLDLGAEAPEEVALSILAEMQAVLGGRDGRPLRERTRPIHE
jgi:xanthine dehydrogenase accessory factor